MINKLTKVLAILLFLSVGICVCKMQKDSVAQVLAKRYSGYSFDKSKSVSQDQLLCILKAAQSAPSSYNDQPWNFIVCDKLTNPDAYNCALNGLVEFNQKWACKAPVLIICVANINSHNQEFNYWAQYDTGAATFGMMLQATSLGLMAHQMGGFDEAVLKKDFNIPDGYRVMSVMAIGYTGPEKINARVRKALNENFLDGAWSKGISSHE